MNNVNKMIDTIIYNRDSVCQGDDYVNRTLEISLPDDSVLEDLVKRILSTRIGNYSGMAYTGGRTRWALESNIGIIAYVCDDGIRNEYPKWDKHTPLKSLGITKVYGRSSGLWE